MRKLLNTLYVLSEDAFLTLDGENVVIKKGKEVVGRFPLHTLENIITFSYQGATPAFMGSCAEKKIGLVFFSPQGKFLAKVTGKSYGNVLLRKEQYRISDDCYRSCFYARNMILGKIYNCRWCLERTVRDHGQRVDTLCLKQISGELQESLQKIHEMTELDSLRGVEGELEVDIFRYLRN